MNDSVFTKIIKGELPADKVYEDEFTIAILPIRPFRDGHVIVIPKAQVDHIWDLDDETYHHLMSTVKKVGNRVREVYVSKRVGVKVVGLEVPHVHVHVFPFDSIPEFNQEPVNENADPVHQAAVAEKLYFE